MKALRYILYFLLISAVAGLIAYQAFVTKDLEIGDLVKAGLILAGILASMFRSPRKASPANKKTAYQKAYPEFIRTPFSDDPRLEKKFYSAVEDYNRDKPDTGLKKLTQLRGECKNSDERFSVTVFTALCLDDMGLYREAAKAYENALLIRPNSSLASNSGLCFQRMGDFEQAEAAYDRAIEIDPYNAYAYNNASAMYFREGDYETALDYAEQAIDCNPNLKEALATAAVCHGLWNDTELFESYYRRAVTAGYDGKKIKQRIRELDPTL